MSFIRRTRSFFQGADGTQYEKFSTKNKPTKKMFGWLFQSIGFLTESDDTSTTTAQGFNQLATDVNARDKNSTADANGYAKTTQPHHLPLVVADKSNVNGSGDTNNSLTVTAYYSTYGRTGGSGYTFIAKNTLAVTVHAGLTFITSTQTAPGANVELGFDTDKFNTAVSNTTVVTELGDDITTINNNIASGYLGEIKMYSFFDEAIGDALCEFDTNGIGRLSDANGGTKGASGNWVGWILLMGQTISGLSNPNTDITDRLDTGAGNIPDTRSKIASSLHNGVAGENQGFEEVGANDVTLTAAQSGVPVHSHANSFATAASGAHTHPYYGATDVGSVHMINDSQRDGDFDHTYTTGSSGSHTHTISGSVTDNIAANAAASHSVRQTSFMVCYAMYVGIDGSET